MFSSAFCNSLLYPTMLSVFITKLLGINQIPGAIAKSNRSFASCTASWYRCTLVAKSSSITALSNNFSISCCASTAPPLFPTMPLRMLTCAPNTQYTKASNDLLILPIPLLVNPMPFVGTSQEYCATASSFRIKDIRFPLSLSPPWSENKCLLLGHVLASTS